MEDRHVPLPTLARLIMGTIDAEDVQQVVLPHLLAVCPGCRGLDEELRHLRCAVGHWDDAIVVLEGTAAPDLLGRLEPLAYDQQLRRIEDDGALQTWALCRLLQRRSLEATAHRPDLAVRLATLSIKISDHLGHPYDRDWVLDLRARAFACLGNARRVVSELQGADDAFHDAHACLRRSGTGSESAQAEVLDLEASLRRDERRFGEALELLDRVIAIYSGDDPEVRDLHLAAQALVKKAYTLEQQGDVEQAIQVLSLAQPWIDVERDPRLLHCLKHNQVLFLVTAGRLPEASTLLPEVKDEVERSGNEMDLARLRWVEGRLAAALGMVGPAEQAYREVQLTFLQRYMGYDAALVSLDLAVLYAREGCREELKQLSLDIFPVFSSLEIHREAMAALILFQEACQEERLTAALACRLIVVLERSRPADPLGQRPPRR